MLMRLSKNTFVRQFGPFTYVIGRINAFDQMFRDAEPFFRWLTREPIEKGELLKRICSVYTGADEQEIRSDFSDHPVMVDRDISHLSLESQIRIVSSFIDLRNILLQQPCQTGPGPHLYGTIEGTDKIGLLPFRIAVGGLLLLPHIRPDQDHERQAHRQPNELDSGVKLVAGEEFEVTLHALFVFQ